MTFEQSVPIAKELAEKQLQRGFDVEAFLILASINNYDIDLVPESNVDEQLTDIQQLFVKYMENKTQNNLRTLLNTIVCMISELYNTCGSLEEVRIFKEYPSKFNSIC